MFTTPNTSYFKYCNNSWTEYAVLLCDLEVSFLGSGRHDNTNIHSIADYFLHLVVVL